jgi:hypothetical protein
MAFFWVVFMATRLYLPASAATVPFSPAQLAGWDDVSILARANCSTIKLGNAMATVSFTDADVTDRDILFRQYISLPLTAGQSITGGQTLKAQLLVSETDAANNLFLVVAVRIFAADGVTVQKQMAGINSLDDTEAAITLKNRRWQKTSASGDYTTVAGDRVVLEIGMSGLPGAGGSHSSSIRFGDSASSDLPVDDSTTSDDAPWFEFASTLTFVDNLTFDSTTTVAMPAGWTSVSAECWGPGGNGGDDGMGSNGGGGGGGAYAKGTVTVTPGTDYAATAPAGGSGSDSWFSTSGTVMAKAGATSSDSNGAAGGSAASSVGTTKFSGGNGGNAFVSGGGGGGAGSATSTANGNNGSAGDVTTGGAGGTGEATGGAGGDLAAAGANGGNPGAGGGGAGDGSGTGANGTGGNGRVKITRIAATSFPAVSSCPNLLPLLTR